MNSIKDNHFGLSVQFLANSGFPVNRGTADASQGEIQKAEGRRVRKVSHSRDLVGVSIDLAET